MKQSKLEIIGGDIADRDETLIIEMNTTGVVDTGTGIASISSGIPADLLPSVNEVQEEEKDGQENVFVDNVLFLSAQENVSGVIGNDGHVIMNPQDATLDHEISTATIDFPVTIHNDGSPTEDSSTIVDSSLPLERSEQQQTVPHPEAKTGPMIAKRKIRKRSRIATISATSDTNRILPVPTNQYICWLVRRAILPLLGGMTVDADQMEDENGQSVYGDTALGMKLSIADTGQVIVQRVTSLIDGRASPAQLTGRIQRGDILLSIDGVSLADNNALVGLKPLQAPDDPKVACQRRYKLRLATGAGLEILKSIEAQQLNAEADSATKIPSEMLGLFPMVDQLSGIPLFDDENSKENVTLVPVKSPKLMSQNMTIEPLILRKKDFLRLDLHISEQLASQRQHDRHRLLNSNDHVVTDEISSCEKIEVDLLSLPERRELGRKAVVGAMNVMKQVENIDAGKDVRSFQSWNTTLSLYSRASIRRRRVFDAASLPSKNFGRVVEQIEEKEEDDNESGVTGKSSADSNDIDGDELLLRLAAHDEIWRKQVIEFLETVALELDNPPHISNEEKRKESPNDINSAMSTELGNFLFGENMAKILSTNRTPRALPSEEVTAVLFDLATKLSASVPDEIKAVGTIISSKSALTPFQEMKRSDSDTDLSLASHFLLESALPVWLKSFRPLTWEHRRILWPVNTVHVGGSTASTLSDDDGLTVDTSNISLHSTITRQHRRKKSIQEIIEDQELDIETRGEACFLVTFYFIHSLLPLLINTKKINVPDYTQHTIATFLQEYGSYLRMDTCLAYASVLKATAVIDLLLSIAKHDPRHREAMKQMSKSTSMVFYEPTMMSAVLQLLHSILTEKVHNKKLAIIDLCAAAYPDIRPWQVEQACYAEQAVDKTNLYYIYLSQLLHPIDGHDSARRDALLVEEWCKISVEEICAASPNEGISQRENFLAVASRTSSYHLVYHRDLQLLLIQSMSILEYGLALDLVSEILENPSLSSSHKTVDFLVSNLRLVAKSALFADDNKKNSNQILRRVIHIYSKPSFRELVDVPKEILHLIRHKTGIAPVELMFDSNVLEFVQFLTDEAIPGDLLKAFIMGETSSIFRPELLPILTRLLTRAATMGSELSASLLRVKQARQRLENVSDIPNTDVDSDSIPKNSIWSRMADGGLIINK